MNKALLVRLRPYLLGAAALVATVLVVLFSVQAAQSKAEQRPGASTEVSDEDVRVCVARAPGLTGTCISWVDV